MFNNDISLNENISLNPPIKREIESGERFIGSV